MIMQSDFALADPLSCVLWDIPDTICNLVQWRVPAAHCHHSIVNLTSTHFKVVSTYTCVVKNDLLVLAY